MHQILQKIPCPNESMTLSSFSTSPYIAQKDKNKKYTPQQNIKENKVNKNKHQEQKFQNDDAYDEYESEEDRNSYDKRFIAQNEYDNSSPNSNSLSITNGTNRQNNMNTQLDETSEQEFQEEQSPHHTVEISNSNILGTREDIYVNDATQEDELEEDEKEEISLNRSNITGKDSPDFNRHQHNTYDDLTISNTVVSNTTYRGKKMNQRTVKEKSMVFADSVLKQQQQKQYSTGNSNSHRSYFDHSDKNIRQNMNFRNEYGQQTTDENCSEEDKSIIEREQEDDEDCDDDDNDDDDDNQLDSSDISGIDSLQQTQISKFSKFQSKSFYRKQNQQLKQDVSDDMLQITKRSPNNQRLALHDESLNLTPSSLDGGQQWIQSQKSILINRQQQTAVNRTSASDQSSQNRLGENLNQLMKNQNFNSTSAINKHNSSLQKDPELLQALEEDSQQQINSRMNSIESLNNNNNNNNNLQSMQSDNELKKIQVQVQRLQLLNKNLNFQLKQEKEQNDEKMMEVKNYQLENQDLAINYKETQEHLNMLKVSIKDNQSLQQMRGRMLDQAKNENKQLAYQLEQKQIQINQMEIELQKKENEERFHEENVNQVIQSYIDQIAQSKIIQNSFKKQNDSGQLEKVKLQEKQQKEIKSIKSNYQKQLDEVNHYNQQLNSKIVEYNQELQNYKLNNQELVSTLKEKEKYIIDLQQEKKKQKETTKLLSQRCKDLEKEIDMIKPTENNSIFGNTNNTLNKTQNKEKGQEFEAKQLKQLFQGQINKERDNTKKYQQQCDDLKIYIQKIEEEYKQGFQNQISQCQMDQELQTQIDKQKQQLNQYVLFELKFRECFNMKDKEDPQTKLLDINQQLEELKILRKELVKYQEQLAQIQNKEKLLFKQNENMESQNKQSAIEMSNFMKQLIENKNKEVIQLKDELFQEKKERQSVEDQLYQQDYTVNLLKQENEKEKIQQQFLENEMIKNKELKQIAEKNVDELKDALREKIRELQVIEKQNQENKISKKSYNVQDQIEKRKYDELINQIFELNLAVDPLQNENILLQQSFIDEQEQAIKHIKEQKCLVNNLIDTLQKDKYLLESEIGQQKQEFKQMIQEIDKMKIDMLGLKEENKQKTEQIQISNFEQSDLIEQCKKLSIQLQESELSYQKILKENVELNSSINKLMRTQNNLFKNGNTKSKNKNDSPDSSKKMKEYEKQIMSYEDQCSKLQQQYDNLCKVIEKQQKDEKEKLQQQDDSINIRDLYRNEVMEMLDKLIDCKTNMPTFNDLAMQLSSRIDKIRSQERLKSQIKNDTNNQQENNKIQEQQQQQQLKSSKGSEKQMEETFKQEMDSLNNEEELVQSIARFLKQSGNGNGKQQFKNFFNNEDNTSLLLFSELITQQNNQNTNVNQNNTNNNNNMKMSEQPLQQEIESLQNQLLQKESDIQTLENKLSQLKIKNNSTIQNENQNFEINELKNLLQQKDIYQRESQEMLSNLQQKNQQIQQKLQERDEQMRQSEHEFNQTYKKKEDLQKQQQMQMKQDFEILKEEMRKQLVEQSEKLDFEYQELEVERIQVKEKYENYKKDLENKYLSKYEQQEKEFREKLLKMEKEIRNGCEKSKEDIVSNIYKEMEDQHNNTIKNLKDEYNGNIQNMKIENVKQIEEVKKIKDREIKRIKEDIEKLKKQNEEKIKKYEQDFMIEKEQLESDFKQKLENLNIKQKKEIKSQNEKSRAEMRNQIDNVKNDMVKAKLEWEREKKKTIADSKQEMEKLKQDYEEIQEQQIKIEKEKIEKNYKKKLEQKDKDVKITICNLEEDINSIQQNHQNELKKERERIESRLKEQISIQLRLDIQEQSENEFKDHMEKLKEKQLQELEKQKLKYEVIIRQEKASQMPKLNEQKTVEIQCSYEQNDNYQIQEKINENKNNLSAINQSVYSQVTQSQGYIDQLKYNFEEELERQQQIFELQLIQKQNQSIKIFEEILILEFDKILQSIFHKQNGNQNMRDLDIKRKEINQIITDILNRNDDRKERQMKISLDTLKQKITEVLRIFKQEVEKKLLKSQNQSKNQTIISQNTFPEIMFSQATDGSSSSFSQTSQSQDFSNKSEQFIQSQPNTMPPTPRIESKKMEYKTQIIAQQLKYQNNEEQKSGQKQQRSDIKRYIEYIDENDEINENILKKVAPVPNKQGVLIVEVDKIVRDLSMLFQTIKQAKFYRLLMSINDQFSGKQEEYDNLDEERGNGEQSAQLYRQILNDFFRLVIKLNNGVDQLSKTNEVYRLKLLISEQKVKLNQINKSKERRDRQIIIEEILNHYGQGGKCDLLCHDGQKIISKLEQTQFQINKLQFGLFQIVDIFTYQDGQELLNKNSIEVNQKCKEYISLNPLCSQQDGCLTQSQLLSSQCSPEQVQKISPELLSPEETAQLIAAVFQKLNETTIPYQTNGFSVTSNNNNNNQMDMYQSFFKTFMSNDEYIKSAENFIQKYKQHQHLNQTLKNPQNKSNLQSNLDYYNTQNIEANNHISNHNQSKYISVTSCPPLQMPKKRSKSQNSAYNQSQNQTIQKNLQQNQQFQSQYQQFYKNPSQASSIYQQQLPNVFQSNILADSKQTLHNNSNSGYYQPILISNYESQSQFSNQFQPQKNNDVLSNQRENNNQNSKIIYQKQESDQLTNAQININSLFKQLKIQNTMSQINEQLQ